MNYIASYRMRHESCCARLYIMQVRPGCAFVLEWNLPFRNPGSATDYTKHIIPSCCLQCLIGPANLLSAISCYKFHISKDQQENMKFTIICHLGAFFVSDYL